MFPTFRQVLVIYVPNWVLLRHASLCRDNIGRGWPEVVDLSAIDGKCLVTSVAVATQDFKGENQVTCLQHLRLSDAYEACKGVPIRHV